MSNSSDYFDSYEIIVVDNDDTLHMCREVPTPCGYSKLVNKKNEVAVLYSPGYGAGFASWTVNHSLQLATDPIFHNILSQPRFFQ